MRGKRNNNTQGFKHIIAWVIILLIIVLVLGTYVKRYISRPVPANIAWEYDLSQYGLVPKILPRSDGGFIIFDRHQICFLNYNRKIESLISANQGNHFILGRCIINHCDDQGNYYFCMEDEVWSFDSRGNERWKVSTEQQTDSDRGGLTRLASCRVSPDSDNILVVYNSDEFAVLDTAGNILNYLPLPFDTFIGAVPLETKEGDYLFGICRAYNQDHVGLAATDRNGILKWEITLPCKVFRYIDQHDSKLVLSDGRLQTLVYDLNGNLQWQVLSTSKAKHTLPYPIIHLSDIRDGVLCLNSDTLSQLTCFSLTGKQKWNVKLAGIQGMIKASEATQYVITHEDHGDSIFYKMVERMNPITASNYYSSTSTNLLVELSNGKVSRQWKLPFEPYDMYGPGSNGELYITSLWDDMLYCIIPD